MTNHRVLCFTTDTQARRQGILRLAQRHGWFLEFKSIYDVTDDWQGDGVLMTSTGYGREAGQRFLKTLKERRTPVVLLEMPEPEGFFPCVTGDNHAIGRLAAKHFNERKFRHAVFFATYDGVDNYQIPCQQARLDGFRAAWRGLTLNTWLWGKDSPAQTRNDPGELHAYLRARLRHAPKPLAVFAWNDFDASRLLNAAVEAGFTVPDDVAILGVDNYRDICESTPVKLSSIKHDLARIGHVGAAMLERLMSGGTLQRNFIRVKPQGIVTRASTDPLAVYRDELRPVMAFIDGNLTRAFGAAEIAAAVKMPRRRLDYLFKTEFRHSVGTEIAARRIALAKRLLRTTDLPIESITAQCGYCNRSFFSKCFQRATGTTPLAWRKGKHQTRAARATSSRACCSTTDVSVVPPSIRAISATRASPVSGWIVERVRPPETDFATAR